MRHTSKALSLLSIAFLGIVMSVNVHSASGPIENMRKQSMRASAPCMEDEKFAETFVVATNTEGGDRSPESIYIKSCIMCHDSGTGGAPEFGNADDWAPRIAKGLDTLYTDAINGLNAMPPKGLCMGCSEAEIKSMVDFMVDSSR